MAGLDPNSSDLNSSTRLKARKVIIRYDKKDKFWNLTKKAMKVPPSPRSRDQINAQRCGLRYAVCGVCHRIV